MNEFAVPRATGEAWAAAPTSGADGRSGANQLFVVGNSPSRAKLVHRAKTYVSISVDTDGHIDFESEVEPEHADQMTDVLLLMLLKAREARKQA